MQQVTNTGGVAVLFSNLLAGVRACSPKCPDCSGPLDRDIPGNYRRRTDAGTWLQVCRACFIGEVAAQLTGCETRLAA